MSAKIWSSVNDVRRELSDAFGADAPDTQTMQALARQVWLLSDHSTGRAVLSAEAWDALDLDTMAREIEVAR